MQCTGAETAEKHSTGYEAMYLYLVTCGYKQIRCESERFSHRHYAVVLRFHIDKMPNAFGVEVSIVLFETQAM